MSTIDFDVVQFKSESMKKVMEQVKDLTPAQKVVIVGKSGTGKKTLAQFILRKLNIFDQNPENQVTTCDEIPPSFSPASHIVLTSDMNALRLDKKSFAVIHLPELIERKEDLVQLAEFHLKVASLIQGKTRTMLTDKSKEKIMQYAWTGQFYEFEQVLEKALQKSITGVIEPEHLELMSASKELELPIGLKLEAVERQYILQTLYFAQQNRTRAAEILGISIRTLRNKLSQYRTEGYL